MDVDTIEPGVDFAGEIFRAVAASQVLVAVIGPAWLTMADSQGRRRLDDPDDLVRLEIETALARRVWVIPVLAEGAVMPTWRDLPETLAGLARRNALTIRHDSFGSDAGRLITAIERALTVSSTTAAAPDTGDARSAGHARRSPVDVVRERLPYLRPMRNIRIVYPDSAPSSSLIERLAERHYLEAGEEFLAIWRLDANPLFRSTDGIAFTTRKISISTGKEAFEIPYSSFEEFQFERKFLSVLAPGTNPSVWIEIKGPDGWRWTSQSYSLPGRVTEKLIQNSV